MSKGRRYSGEQKLNYKKVFAVIIAIIVIIMGIVIVKKLITKAKQTTILVASYYSLYADNKWGILNSKGETVIEPMYQEMLIVPDKTKDVFLCIYDVNSETGEYKTKVINSKNEQIYTQYDKVEALENYDANGNAWYEENVLKVQKDGKYGIIDISGKEVASIQYESIETLKGVKNSLLVKKDGKYGLINNSGVTLVECNYKEIKKVGDTYEKGYITINEENKYGLVSYTGNEILENKYEKIEQIYGENYFVIEKEGKQKLIDKSGNIILEEGYDKITQIASLGAIIKKDNKYGLIGFDKETKIKPTYQDLKEMNTGIFVAQKDDKKGIIDLNNETKLKFEYIDIYYNEKAGIYIAEDASYNSSIMDTEFNIKLTGILSELNTEAGYMKLKVGESYKYYNFKFEEKDVKDVLTKNTLYLSKRDGKYGFVDKDGKVVVDYIYEEAYEQNEYGFAAVKKDGLWGAIDQNGKVVIEPKYNLDNNLLIDFIGKWHLGQDINMNYYCEK